VTATIPGKARTKRKCVRAIRRGERVYLVSIPGSKAAWLKNIRANPAVRLRIRDGTYAGAARELRGPIETDQASGAYRERIYACDYVTCALHRRGLPTPAKTAELIGTFFDQGIPLVIDLQTR
jgi:deazaflavin-dependent oxidoreductase (nitroreductase family)